LHSEQLTDLTRAAFFGFVFVFFAPFRGAASAFGECGGGKSGHCEGHDSQGQ